MIKLFTDKVNHYVLERLFDSLYLFLITFFVVMIQIPPRVMLMEKKNFSGHYFRPPNPPYEQTIVSKFIQT